MSQLCPKHRFDILKISDTIVNSSQLSNEIVEKFRELSKDVSKHLIKYVKSVEKTSPSFPKDINFLSHEKFCQNFNKLKKQDQDYLICLIIFLIYCEKISQRRQLLENTESKQMRDFEEFLNISSEPCLDPNYDYDNEYDF